MAQSAYQVRLKAKDGSLAAVFTHENLRELTVTRSVNGVATHSVTIDATRDGRCDLFAVDGQVEVWRRPPGQAWYLEYEGFHRDATWAMDADGRELFTSAGVGYQDLLARRAIAAYAGSAGAAKAGAAESVVKAFVVEQAGASAPAADRTDPSASSRSVAVFRRAGSSTKR